MGIIKFTREGSWWISSQSDPRWNDNGRAMVGMFERPPEVDTAIEAKKAELGEEPPEDLEWGYMKD
jgi:hypothetical protein